MRSNLVATASALVCAGFAAAAFAVTPAELLVQYATEASVQPSAARGEAFFTGKHGQDWACATCHGAPPTRDGAHAMTKKRIAPLAPAFNPDVLNDRARADKWFKRNCGDVLGRPCTAAEKADVLAYLTGLRK
jgi:cytochrome c peroxidase